MKAKHIEDGLALVGALIVLIGVSFAAENALAEETANVKTTAVAIHNAAEKATADAAARAADSLAMENSIDLDIKIGDRTSTLIAGKK